MQTRGLRSNKKQIANKCQFDKDDFVYTRGIMELFVENITNESSRLSNAFCVKFLLIW